jgi:hypothetical protein
MVINWGAHCGALCYLSRSTIAENGVVEVKTENNNMAIAPRILSYAYIITIKTIGRDLFSSLRDFQGRKFANGYSILSIFF